MKCRISGATLAGCKQRTNMACAAAKTNKADLSEAMQQIATEQMMTS